MNFDDLLGKPALRNKKAVKASGDVHEMLAFSHSILGSAAHTAGREGRQEEKAVFEKAQEAVFTAIRILMKRAEPTVRLARKSVA